VTSSFESTPMNVFLKHRKDFFVIDDATEYKRVRVRLHARGIVLRDQVYGGQLRTKKQQATKAGDLLVAEIDAKVGGVGIVPGELADAIVSSHYFLYEIDGEVCDPKYLEYYIRSGAVEEQFQEFVQGSTNYASIRAHHTLQLRIPLPPLDEQRRIVARIEELAALIEEAQALRAQAQDEAGATYRTALSSIIHPKDSTWKTETVNDVIVSIDAGWSPRCEPYPARTNQWGVLKTTSVQWCQFLPEENKKLPEALEPRPDLSVEAGEVLVTRAGPRKRVGVVTAVRESRPNLMISDKLIRLRPAVSRIDPVFLQCALASPLAQEYLFHRKTGLASAQENISQKILRSTPVVYPPLDEQRRIVAYLDVLQAQLKELASLQAATQAELQALLPSVLDRAFRGEL